MKYLPRLAETTSFSWQVNLEEGGENCLWTKAHESHQLKGNEQRVPRFLVALVVKNPIWLQKKAAIYTQVLNEKV